MIFKSLHVDKFGKLSNFDLQFCDGRNLILQQNGYGKSTICAFIKAMFYGLSATKQNVYVDKELDEKETLKWKPWSESGSFGGSITFVFEDKEYRIERSFVASPKRDECVLVCLTNGKIDTDVQDETLGQRFFGLSAKAFLRSAFIPQNDVTLANEESFSNKLSGMVTGGDVTNAVARLTEYSRSISGNRANAELVVLQKQKAGIVEKIEKVERAFEEVYFAEENLKRAKNELSRLQNELEQTKREKERIIASRTPLSHQSELINTKSERVALELELETLEKFDRAEKDAVALEKIKSEKHAKNWILGLVGCLFVVTVVFFILQNWAVASVFSVASVCFGLFFVFDKNNTEKQKRERMAEILEKYNLSCSVEKAIEILKEKFSALQKIQVALVRCSAKIAILEEKQDDGALQKQNELSEKETNIQHEITRISNQIGAFQKTVDDGKNLPSVSTLEASLADVNVQIENFEFLDSCAKKAIVLLQKSKDELSQAYLPKLAAIAKEYLSTLTNGEFEQIVVNDKFELSLVEKGQTQPLSRFSRGVQEQVLFAFRLALCKIVSRDSVLIIDDAFVDYDETRFNNAISLLKTLNNQIVYFSCHDRSKNFLK